MEITNHEGDLFECNMETKRKKNTGENVQPETLTFPGDKYVENAFLLTDQPPDEAYYVLTGLRNYGNSILSEKFTRRYGLLACRTALQELTSCDVKFTLPKYDADTYYVLSVEDCSKIRLPPGLQESDFKIYTQILINKVLLEHPDAEQKFNSVMNGSLDSATYEDESYSMILTKEKLIFTDKKEKKRLWLDPGQIVHEMYEEL